jgi:TPR repeat protein
MRNLSATVCLTIAVFLGSVGVSWSADFQKGITAYKSGDFATTMQEWKPLADQGHGRAQNGVGVLYYLGKGVPKNYKTAVKYFKLSAKNGDMRGQNSLGDAYLKGHGVSQDYKTAVKWFTVSAKQGYPRAKTNLEKVEKLIKAAEHRAVANKSPGSAQSLLDKLSISDEKAKSIEIYELLKPILLYDTNVVKVSVLDDIGIFNGINNGIRGPDDKDDRDIRKWLNAKSGDILLKVNVQVDIAQDYVSKIKEKLSALANLSEPMDGTSCKRCRTEIANSHALKIYVGSIFGNNRKELYLKLENPTENIQESHYALGMKNSKAGGFVGGKKKYEGLYVKQPFSYYGFNKSSENGKICINLLKEIIGDIQPPGVVSEFTKQLKPAHDPHWRLVFPHIAIKFLDGRGKVVNEDELIFDHSRFRTASASGFGSAKVGENDTYKSIVSMDRSNGWHKQDFGITGMGVKYYTVRFSEITNSIKFQIKSKGNQNCRIGIAEQTNFSIITKVNKEILGKTQKVTVDMYYNTF